MNENKAIFLSIAVIMLALVILLGGLIIAKSEHADNQQKSYRECIKSYTPAECRASTWGLDYGSRTVDK